MPQNWKTYKLSEVTTKIGSGSTPRGGKEAYKESGISLIRSQNILDFKFSIDGLAFIDDMQASKLSNVIIKKQDVLLNITGDSVARVCSVPCEFLPARVNQHVAILRADNKLLDATYLKYVLLEPSNKNILLTLASAGATRNALTKTMIENFEISIPNIKEQKAIASILSTLDDKIELNLQQNKTLEEMAMALYKHWFVDFGPFQDGEFVESVLGMIPEGWEVKRLDEISMLLAGGDKPKNYSKELNEDLKIPIYSNGISNEGLYGYTDIARIKKESITVSARGTIGFVCLRMQPYLPIVRLISIVPNREHISSKFLFLCLKTLNIQGTGTTQQQLTVPDFKETKIVIPNIELVNEFTEIMDSTYENIVSNKAENQTLTQLRDTLLPKLICGEVRVKDVEKTLSEML
jgi:type I restriction enzyme S subunit